MVAFPVRTTVISALLALISVFQITALDTNAWEWRFVAGGATVGAGAFSPEGRYYFPAEDRYLYALDPNGVMIWRTDLGRRATGGIAVLPDGTIIVTLARGRVVALNMDGLPIWEADLEGDNVFAPVVYRNGIVVLADRSGQVGAWTHHGRLVWQVGLDEPITAAPISTSDGTLVIATSDGSIELLRPDGALVQRRYIGEVATTLVSGDRIYLGSSAGRVIAIDLDGEPIWRADVGSAVQSLRVLASGDVLATTDDGSLARVTESGVVAWRVAPGTAQMLPAESSVELIAASTDGVVTSLDLSGNLIWQMRLPDQPTAVTRGTTGQLIVSTQTWVTYAYSDGTSPDVTPAWGTSRANPSRSGGTGSGRQPAASYNSSAPYLASWGLIRSGSQSQQTVTMRRLWDRAWSGRLQGDYHWILEIAEYVAGAPYLGPISQSGTPSIARRARTDAIRTVGLIGDLYSVELLVTLMEYEPDPVFQAEILGALGRLGAVIDAEFARRLRAQIARDVATGPDDRLAASVVEFVLDVDEFRGGYMNPEIADVLLLIASSNYSRAVRTDALDALRAIARADAP